MNSKEYAAHRKALGLTGGTHPAVLRAIKDGRLTGRSTRKVGDRWDIDPVIADREWASNTNRGSNNPSGKKGSAPVVADHYRAGTDAGNTAGPDLAAGIPDRNVSRAIREAYLAKLAGVQYEKESGARVLKEEVKKEAFELGRRVREAMINIPDRVAYDFAAIDDATEIHLRLTQAINEALEELTK